MRGAAGQGQATSFPVVIYNPPGLSAINYRVGDFSSFREALLQNLPGEVELKNWRPSADGDLALQLLEWWAYIADIITFYNERIANNSYIGTAVLPILAQTAGTPSASSATPGLPDNATLIAGALGFRTTPGIAAIGQLAVLVNASTRIMLPPNFAIQSKPGPGQQPQIFEAVASTNMYLPTTSGGAVPVDLSCPTFFTTEGVTTNPSAPSPVTEQGPLVKGAISGIKVGDMVVIAEIASPPANATSMAVTVQSVTTENDPRGRANTRLTLLTPFTLPSTFTSGSSPDVSACQVLRGIQSAATYAFSNVLAAGTPPETAPSVCGLVPKATPVGVHLAALVRDIAVGDLVVLEIVTIATPPPAVPATYVTAVVSTYQETVWYANADTPATAPQTPPAGSQKNPPTEIAIPIPHTFITLESAVETGTLAAMDPTSGQTVTQAVTRVWYGYRPVSTLLDEIPASPIQSASTIGVYNVQPAGVVSPTFAAGTTVLVEGADGLGAAATLTESLTVNGPIKLNSSSTEPLALPLRLLFNVIDVTAGKTVTNEVLGNGDGTVPSQSFTLAKSPLTYLPGTNPGTPVSTLQVQVDNVAWTEVANFNGQAATAKVFVTQQDKNQNTTVTFGDGLHGSRLTTGTANVTATYRYGSGPGDPSLGGPPPTTLVTILTPYPGLGSVRNPVPMTGGAAPSSPVQVQQSAPSTALTFGHAVSPSDYQAIAAQTPSVTRAQAWRGWDPVRRRLVTTVYVDGAAGTVGAVQAALAPATDPNHPPVAAAATAIDLQIGFNLSYNPSFDPAGIATAVTAALADPVTGLFAAANIGIGETLYDSQIYSACLSVPGVLAVRSLFIANITNPSVVTPLSGVAHAPGPGCFFSLAAGDVHISLEAGNG